MPSRITIFDTKGYFVGDIRASAPRSWILNAAPVPGECNIPVSKYDAKAALKYLEFGNLVLVRHETLPDWLGVIVNRRWSSGYINVKVLQVEYLLSKRHTPILDVTGNAGGLFTQILELTNNLPYNEKPIYANSVYSGSPERSRKLGTDALSILQELAVGSGNDMEITYAFDNNKRIYLVGNWHQRRGDVLTAYLREGKNIRLADGVLEEDARSIANVIEGRGDASTTGSRLNSWQIDEASISRYGMYSRTTVFNGNREQATIDNNTLNLLRASKDPASSYDVTALNVDETFYNLDLGNVLNLELNSYGFFGNTTGTNEQVEIAGMEYDDDSDTCRLILEKYTDAN